MAPTPGPSYGPKIASNTAPQLSPEGAVPAPVSTFTGGDAIKDNLAMAAKQNAVVQGGNGVKVGGSRKRKRSYKQRQYKRSYKQRRNNRSNKHRRHRRSRRGGRNDPTPRPTVTVPQFPNQGGANAASVNLNGGAMAQAEQAKFDNPNIAGPTQHFP
jgi:hypothetical protein